MILRQVFNLLLSLFILNMSLSKEYQEPFSTIKSSTDDRHNSSQIPFYLTTMNMYPNGATRCKMLFAKYSELFPKTIESLDKRRETLKKQLRSHQKQYQSHSNINAYQTLIHRLSNRIDQTGKFWEINLNTLLNFCRPFDSIRGLAMCPLENHQTEKDETGQHQDCNIKNINNEDNDNDNIEEDDDNFNIDTKQFVFYSSNSSLSESYPHNKKNIENETINHDNNDNYQQNETSTYDDPFQAIAHLARDWSAQGVLSRQELYEPILTEMNTLYPPSSSSPSSSSSSSSSSSASSPSSPSSSSQLPTRMMGFEGREGVHVLVPGAGAGRLAWELACLGFNVHANDVSVCMLSIAHKIMNMKSNTSESFLLYPDLHRPDSNQVNSQNRFEPVTIPDTFPTDLLNSTKDDDLKPQLSFTHGDFRLIYQSKDFKEKFQVVITNFFIDTSKNVLEYLETIRHVLTEGGIWINHGPLQWHHDNSIQLSLEEVYM